MVFANGNPKTNIGTDAGGGCMAINIQMKQDVSYLFSGLNNNNTTSSILGSDFLSQYASIKNGSYSKLMKAYFSECASDEVKSLADKDVSATEDAKSYAKVQSTSDALKESADALLESGEESLFAMKEIAVTDENGVETKKEGYDTESIYKAVSSFVTNYNATVRAAGDSGNDSLINKAENMANRTISNLKQLSSVGISMSESGVLSIDRETFMDANMSTVKGLFQGVGSYGYNISAQASLMNYAAQHAANSGSSYNAAGKYSSSFSSGNLFETWF